MLTRRHLMAASAASLAAGAMPARAQADWPNRPVKVIVIYPPAGGADTTARILFQKLSEMWGKSFVIDNRGGAGGTIGEAVAAKSDPDGYTHSARRHRLSRSTRRSIPSCRSTTARISSRCSWLRSCPISWW